MSLLTGLLRDNLLQGVARAEVYVALRSDFLTEPNRFGAGTKDDPYDASLVGGVYKFDKIMRDFVKQNTTVNLAPGIYYTQGYQNDDPNIGWSAKSGVRLIGAGWSGSDDGHTPPSVSGNTVLKLDLTSSDTGARYAIGCTTAYLQQLTGFELAHLAIDSSMSAAGTGPVAAGAININGREIRVHNVRFFNFGAAGMNCDVVTIARATDIQSLVRNNIVEGCIFDQPGSLSANCNVTCIRMSGYPTYGTHDSCIVRGNFIDCGVGVNSVDYTSDFRGIGVTGGRGTVIESNQIWNCRSGFKPGPVDHGTSDMTIRNNVFENVLEGLVLEMSGASGYAYEQLIVESNLIDLTEIAGMETPVGMMFDGQHSTNYHFKEAVVRFNQVRHREGLAGPEESIGITLDSIETATLVQNLINVGADPLYPDQTKSFQRTASVGKITTFNDRTSAGVFLGCYNTAALVHDGDLVTDSEVALISI